MASGLGWLLALALGIGIGAAGVAAATAPRISELERKIGLLENENQALRTTTVRQGEHIQSLAGYLKEQDRRITSLENEMSDLRQEYDAIVANLETVQSQVQDEEVKRIIGELIRKARQRKQSRLSAYQLTRFN